MKVAVIHGSPRKGVTYEAINFVKAEMQKLGPVEFADFHLPQDLPGFCKGCFACFLKGEDKCPDAKHVQPIVDAMVSADAILIGTPVYALQISGGLKAFLDHTAYCFLNHRPRFFRQKALVIATTAGAGIGNCLKQVRQNLSYWGISKTYTCGHPTWAIKWDEIPQDKKEKMIRSLRSTAQAFYRDIAAQKAYSPSFLQVIMFNAGKALALSNEEANTDRQYWQEQGWLEKRCHYYHNNARIGVLKKAVGRLVFLAFGPMLKSK